MRRVEVAGEQPPTATVGIREAAERRPPPLRPVVLDRRERVDGLDHDGSGHRQLDLGARGATEPTVLAAGECGEWEAAVDAAAGGETARLQHVVGESVCEPGVLEPRDGVLGQFQGDQDLDPSLLDCRDEGVGIGEAESEVRHADRHDRGIGASVGVRSRHEPWHEHRRTDGEHQPCADEPRGPARDRRHRAGHHCQHEQPRQHCHDGHPRESEVEPEHAYGEHDGDGQQQRHRHDPSHELHVASRPGR